MDSPVERSIQPVYKLNFSADVQIDDVTSGPLNPEKSGLSMIRA